ncbi:hypothetical protein AN191_07035 [Loktanella sp. 5RATIMAR09]|uniref:hypothetical protein n=1 Tax=Loktanella sp. 5RATIMAR09 TaxID=1225655 RepID=UPI0006EBD919|nr:hypothetical protein [Loktanella sp. 5RATIMAR09]KQI72755.1 hypothetical protein AN191_07035 [Loktanella sp. 5RATIMAR09]
MIKTSMTVAALSVLAIPAFAQELTYGAFDLDYTTFSSGDGGGDLTRFDLQGEGEFTLDQFVFGAGISNDKVDYEDGDEFTVRILDGYAGYEITPEVLVGAGFANANIDFFFGEDDFSGYDLFGQYQTGAFGVAINYSRPDDEFDEIDITTLYAEGEVAPGVTVGGIFESFSEIDETSYFLSAEYDAGQIFGRAYYTSLTDVDFAVYGVRGAYRFDDAISINGGVEAVSGDDFISEYTALSIGGEYAFAPGIAATARYTSIDTEFGGETDAFAIGLSYEMGASKRLDRNMMDDAKTDLETGFFGAQPSLGFGLLTSSFFFGPL